jgi:hypothetical protein
MKRLYILMVFLISSVALSAQAYKHIGSCKFVGDRPQRQAQIGSLVYYHNGSVKKTKYEGGKDIYTGSGDVWVIFKSRQLVDKTLFRVQGQVQVCHDY